MFRLPRRLTIRMRTLLVLVAASSLGLAHTATAWRHGQFRFQRRYADIASSAHQMALMHRHEAAYFSRHEAAGHRCPWCAQYPLPMRVYRERTTREAEAQERRFRWYSLLAGPAFDGTYNVSI